MAITFEPFRNYYNLLTKENNQRKNKEDLIKETGFSRGTAQKIWYDGMPNLSVIDTLCSVYQLKVEQVIRYMDDVVIEPNDSSKKK